MSTIVVPRNNGNWVADAVVNFVGPIIGDWIKSEREKEINRKNNVAIHEAIKSLGLGNNDYSNLPPSMPNNNGGLLGGSSNGWENASRNMSDNPLTQFDNNTADIAPSVNTPATSTPNLPTQQHIPTPAEFLQTMYNVVGSNPKRFGLVNMENLQKLAAPIMAAYQADLTRQEKQKLADDFLNAAGDYAKQRNIMTSGYINGTVPYEAVNGATHNYEYENPHLIPGSYNAGGESYFYGYNPRTGEYNFNAQVNNSLTPQQKQQGEQWDREFAEQARRYDDTMDYNRSNSEWEHGFKERVQSEAEKQSQWERDNPTLTSFRGFDGTLYLVNLRTGEVTEVKTPDGKSVKVNPNTTYTPRIYQDNNGNFVIIDPTTRTSTPVIAQDGSQQQGQPRKSTSTNRDLTDSQKIQYNTITKEAQDLRKEAEKLRKELGEYQKQLSIFAENPNDSMYIGAKENIERINGRLAQIDTRLNQIEAEKNKILGNTSNNTNNTGNTPFLTPQEKQNSQNNEEIVADTKPPYRTDVSPDVKPAPRKKGDKVNAQLPDEIWYDPNRDKDIPEQRVMSIKEFKDWFETMLGDPNLKHLTPEQMLQIAIEDGIRIRPDNTQSSLPPEVTGTTFMGEELPGLQSNGNLATSLTPMGLSKSNSEKYSHGPLVEAVRGDEGLPPIPKEFLSPSYELPKAKDLGYVMQGVPDNINNSDLENYISRNILGLPIRIDKIEKGKNISDSNGNPILWISRNGDYGISQKTYDDLQKGIQEGKYPNFTSEQDLDDILYDELRYRPISEAGAVNRKAPPPPSQPPRNKPHFTPHDKWKYYRSDAGQYNDDFDNSEMLAARNTKGVTSRRKRRVRATAPRRTARRPGQIRPNTSYEQLKNEVDDSARRHGLEPELVRAIIQAESRWDSNALSTAGARGLMQLMPKTAAWLGVRDSYDPAQNIEGGTKYIARLIRQYRGNVAKALMAYNCGPGNVNKGRIPASTRKYARSILATYNRLKNRRGR